MEDANLKIEKIKKTSKVILVVTNMAKSVATVVAAVCIIMGILVMTLQVPVNNHMGEVIENGSTEAEELLAQMDIEFLELLAQTTNFSVAIGTYMITIGLLMLGIAVLFHFIGRVFKNFQESYSPFVPKILKELKVTFVLIALLSFGAGAITGVVVSLALWSVFYVFEYGCDLQKQSDETI